MTHTEMDDELIFKTVDGPPMDIFTASSLGLNDVVYDILLRGHDVNQQNASGWTPLMYACISKRDNLVWNLLNSGADITLRDLTGKTFFFLAAEIGNFKAVALLKKWLEHKDNCLSYVDKKNRILACVNLKEFKTGHTPIMIASCYGDIKMIDLLIHFGADLTMTDANGQTAMQHAQKTGQKSAASLLKFHAQFTVEDILIEIGLEKYAKLFTGVTVDNILSFDDSDLQKLGLKLLGPRKRLKMAIENLLSIKENIMGRLK